MTGELQRTDTQALTNGFTHEQVGLIKRVIAKDATDDELKLFLYTADKRGLDPLAKQIYFQKRKTKNGDVMTIITSIDGYRLIAERTGKYAGNDDPVYFSEDDRRAAVTVWKIVNGVRCPFTASARWSEYYPGQSLGFMWDKMPHTMLGKCAEALALRKAFPEQLSGLYVVEEMEQADKPIGKAPISTARAISTERAIAAVEKQLAQPIKASKPVSKGYDGGTNHQKILQETLKSRNIDESIWEVIHEAMMGKSFTDLDAVVKEATSQ